jgi:DNA-binding HxlR family transcriptional regulator
LDWDQFFRTSDIRILLYLYEEQEARYSELEKNVVTTRSVLSVSLQDLTKRQLIERTVEPTKPIRTQYRLSGRGQELVQHLLGIQQLVAQ